MTALIIDDSELDRLNLSTLITDHLEIEILGEASNVESARKMISTFSPDFIFLDIHLGKEMGFSVLRGLENPPQVILTTSHPQYALQGFDVEALDYILKPVTSENLARSVDRLQQRFQHQAATDLDSQDMLTLDSPLFLKDKEEFCVHPVSDVALITTDRPYSIVHTSDGSEYLHRRAIIEWKRILPSDYFIALDRSTLVNIQAIGKLTPLDDKHQLHFTPENVTPLTISPSAFRILRDFLHV